MCNFNLYIANILYHKNMHEGPNICKLDNKNSFMHVPSKDHMAVGMRILSYLKGAPFMHVPSKS